MKVSENGELRDATRAEIEALETARADEQTLADVAAEQAAARASAVAKLSALGLTDAEISALLGA